jgi:uncharacterized protein
MKKQSNKGKKIHREAPAATDAAADAVKENLTSNIRPVEQAGEVANPAQAQSPQDEEEKIPDRYNDNKVVLMVRDPYWCYTYWEITDKLLEEKRNEMKEEWGDYSLILRVYDVTGVEFDGTNSNKFQDIRVNSNTGNWYINVWEPGRDYQVEIGYRSHDGHFIMILRSNMVSSPPVDASESVDEEWMEMSENSEELFRLSSGGRIGSSEQIREVQGMERLTHPGGSEQVPGPTTYYHTNGKRTEENK